MTLKIIGFSFAFFVAAIAQAQDTLVKKRPFIDVGFGKGFTIGTPDSNFTVYIGGRMQTMVESRFDLNSGTGTVDFSVRRARVYVGASAFKGKLQYKMTLCFSPRDVFADNVDEPNTLFLRDAMLYYQPNKYFMVGLGMTKLPGNRQRVNSSGRLQLVERSNANNLFTLDRDKGIWFHTYVPLGKKVFMKNILAISMGEGRVNAPVTAGLCYTFRTEILPMGKFTADGDYFEGDLVREPKPKLSIAGVYSFNHQTSRLAGQLGDYFYDGQLADIQYFGGDFIFKWRGFCLLGQYYARRSSNGVSVSDDDPALVRASFSGQSVLVQAGYMVSKKDEIAARYSLTTPDAAARPYIAELHEIVLGYSHYFLGHNLKLQTDVTWLTGPGKSQIVHRLNAVVAF